MYTRKRLKRQGDMQHRSDSENIYIYIFSAIRFRRFPLGIACLARKQYVWLLCASSLTAKCEVACRVVGSTFAPTTATVPRLLVLETSACTAMVVSYGIFVMNMDFQVVRLGS